MIPTHSPETYTACMQAIVNGQDFGASDCKVITR
jgi:hypothetical protein